MVMRKRSRVFLTSVLGMLVISLMAQPAAFADNGRLYGEAGAGLVIFKPPEKDSFPFYETNGGLIVGLSGRVESPLEFDPDDTAVSGHLLFGYRLGGPEPAGICGANFRVEFSTNFYFPEYSRTKSFKSPERNTPSVGALMGAFYSNDGMEGIAILGANGAFPISGVPDIRFNADYDYIDFTLNVRSDYALMKDVLTLSPYIGLTLAYLEQNFSYSNQNPVSLLVNGVLVDYDYAVDEDLDSWYAGLVIGADVIFNVTPELSFTLGGSFSPLYAQTDLDLTFDGDSFINSLVNPKESMTTKVSDSNSNWTFRAMAKAEVNYRINWFAISLSGMVDWWDDVPVVDYPDYSAGDWFPLNYSDKVPQIDGKHMLNYGTMLKVTFYFM
jgi:hypothetical protein